MPHCPSLNSAVHTHDEICNTLRVVWGEYVVEVYFLMRQAV
jgi:hypothetical protein